MIAPITPKAMAAAKPSADETLAKTAKAFEAVFMRQMIASMRSASLAEDDLFGSSAGEQFRDLSDSRLADSMADGKGFGIAELLIRQLGGGTAGEAPAASETRK